jgi:carbon storage regulator
MLVLSRKETERLFIGDNIVITVIEVDRGKVRIGIDCPKDIKIFREELLPRKENYAPLPQNPGPDVHA